MDERMGEGYGPREDEIKEGVSRVGHLMDDVKQKGAHLLGNMKRKVSDGADSLRTKSLDEIGNDVRNYVQEKPGRVILASFVIGLIVGAMVRSGRDRG